MPVLVANNASSRLSASIATNDNQVAVMAGEGAKFPNPSAGDWFPLTLVKSTGALEIVKATNRNGDLITVERAQENTAALNFDVGDRIDLRITAAVFDALTAQASEMANLLPPGTGPIPWSRPTEPVGWIFCDGRTLLSNTPYTALRNAYIADGFPWGQDGSGNPKIPDMRGRVSAGTDNMGGTAANRLTGATTIGASLGAETHTLTAAQMPSHTHTASTAAAGSHTHTGSTDTEAAHTHSDRYDSTSLTVTKDSTSWAGGGQGTIQGQPVLNVTRTETANSTTSGSGGAHSHALTINAAADHSHTVTVNSAGSGAAHNNVQPTVVTNMIVKT